VLLNCTPPAVSVPCRPVCSAADSLEQTSSNHSPVSPSDHLPIFSSLSILPSIPPPLTQISFHCFKSISVSKFTRDILHSRLIVHPPPNLSDPVDAYNSTLSSLIDIHVPLKTKTIQNYPKLSKTRTVVKCGIREAMVIMRGNLQGVT